MLYARRQRQPSQKVTEVVRQREQLKPNLVVHEVVTREPRPAQRVLTFFDPLLRPAALVVEPEDAAARPHKVADHEASPGKQLALMPLNLRDNPTRPVPATRLIREAVIQNHGLLR